MPTYQMGYLDFFFRTNEFMADDDAQAMTYAREHMPHWVKHVEIRCDGREVGEVGDREAALADYLALVARMRGHQNSN